MSLAHIPAEMRAEPRWCLWRFEERKGKPRKVPKQVNGVNASTTNPDTWTTYEEASAAFAGPHHFDGLGFFLGGGWAGVDFDDVIIDGETKPWAEDLILKLNSYSEISPSGSGVKVFVKGDFPDTGKNVKVDGSGLEVYCEQRYFTVTGDHYGGTPLTVNESQDALHDLRYRFFDDGLASLDDPYEVMKRRVEQMPEAVDGEDGGGRTVAVACELARCVRRGELDEEQAWDLLLHYNRERCHPPWDEIATTGEDSLRRKWEAGQRFVEKEFADKGEPAPRIREPFSLDLIPDREFDQDDKFDQTFLIENLIVAGEHLILGGPQKTAKTSILVDIAVSAATGADCLGYFSVPEPVPVIVISGESGGATLQKTARRVRDARGVSISDNLHWGLRLPNLSLREHLEALERDVRRLGAKLVAIDPAYLAMLSAGDADGAKNVMFMGTILNAFGAVGKKTGATLLLVHHFNKQIKQGQPPGLSNLSQSGFAEWARQWVLLNHNKPYRRGEMELRVNVGGSAGHGGNYLWRIDQGRQVVGGVGWTDWKVEVEDLDAPDFDNLDEPVQEKVKAVWDWIAENPKEGYSKTDLYKRAARMTPGRDTDEAKWAEILATPFEGKQLLGLGGEYLVVGV